MSDIMRPIPFGQLMEWILKEHQGEGSIFGISKLVSYGNKKAAPIFSEKIESPFGPAAGPNTQLAQNIIASYVTGARFFELKTVQIMDGEELSKCVAKPCITAGDECYNCEWSTELTVPQAYDEYVKGWFACKILAKELSLGDPDGFVFNMSVGYDLDGIKSKKIDDYIEGMKDASGSKVWKECMEWALANVDKLKNVDAAYLQAISPKISNSITESTLHGCPPAEIERIASYLITEKGLNTYVKCNPTLLGYEFARKRLDSLGFDYIAFDDHHFAEDLQWKDAVPMFHRLTELCQSKGLEFGVKLTNTFPVDVKAKELPSEEMYMSGRSLFPLTITLASRVSQEFNGKLRISYSGGADIHNIQKLVGAGIWPVTMATTILKPGGYERMSQIGAAMANWSSDAFDGVNIEAVKALEAEVPANKHYNKQIKPLPNRKIARRVPLVDCFTAPCRGGCPIEQDIPAYLMAVGEGKYVEALKIITQRNALPFITGTICPHHCADKCMRNYYDESVYIRNAKLKAAQGGYDELLSSLASKTPVAGKKVAIVGGGPAGLAAAFFLSREGVDVTVFESRNSLGGIVRHVIPEFRIDSASIDKDVELCKAYGAKFELGVKVESVEELKKKGYTHIILAVGAWKHGASGLKQGEALNVIEFLEKAKKDPTSLSLGSDVVIIGGGNTAMDAVRAAKKIPGVQHVRLVYRRTKRYMPADEEELTLAIEDGVEFMELLAPVRVENNILTCSVMELGAPDESGRRSPVDTGKVMEMPATTVITAIGEQIDSTLFDGCKATMDAKGRPVVDDALKTQAEHVYAIGDARRGPATVVEAIADAAEVARDIIGADFEQYTGKNVGDAAKAYEKKGVLCSDCESCEDSRCLGCATVCETCVGVCPNRANVAIKVAGKRQKQIIHVDGMCNECGNCAVFCPYESRPYKDKFTLFWSKEDFDNSENEGFLLLGAECMVRFDGSVKTYNIDQKDCGLVEDLRMMILTVRDSYAYLTGK